MGILETLLGITGNFLTFKTAFWSDGKRRYFHMNGLPRILALTRGQNTTRKSLYVVPHWNANNILRMRFFKKIQDWILKSENGFCVSFLNRLIQDPSDQGTEESTLGKDFSVPLMHHDLSDLGLICLVTKRKISFRI